VLLLDEKRKYEVLRDEVLKVINLPHWQAEAEAAKVDYHKDPGLLGVLISGPYTVHRAQGRLEQRLALLRHVEALRIYAAHHDGNLPEKLADLTVPLPNDPFTGAPFIYKLEGKTAHIRGTPPPSQKNNPGFNVRYEITIRK
jgi:hypothetical protein